MKKKFNLLSIALINSLLVLLGFAACSDSEDDGGGMVEYGTPSATYKVRGTAVDEKTKEPVKGLQAFLYIKQVEEGQERIRTGDMVLTDSKGAFEIRIGDGSFQSDRIELRLEDIDGEDNGVYGTYDDKVDFTDATSTNEGNWHRQLSKDIGKIEMGEPETEEPEIPEEPTTEE